MEAMVRSALVTAWRLATWPTIRSPDEGASFELGYCFAKGKRCIAYKTDARCFIGGYDNVMLHGAPEIVLRSEDELRDYFSRHK